MQPPGRHCERSEAIQADRTALRPWIASSLALHNDAAGRRMIEPQIIPLYREIPG
jgi:hypothetical protein